MAMELSTVDALLAACGLIRLGAFRPTAADRVPGIDRIAGKESDRQGKAVLVIVGNAGPAMWRVFDEQRRRDTPDPLDDWSRRTLTGVAAALSENSARPVTALFPFDGPPYSPFQKWAQKSGDAYPSPLGPMVHKLYGLWHAYRGALLIDAEMALPPAAAPSPSPCEACTDRPCLSACPVTAFTDGGYDVPACVEHLAGGEGDRCFQLGCLARRACPVGRRYAYGEQQARFHLGKFFAARRS